MHITQYRHIIIDREMIDELMFHKVNRQQDPTLPGLTDIIVHAVGHDSVADSFYVVRHDIDAALLEYNTIWTNGFNIDDLVVTLTIRLDDTIYNGVYKPTVDKSIVLSFVEAVKEEVQCK